MTPSTDDAAWFKRTDFDRTGGATRATLLASAESVISERGFADASVARITERAGTSRATFYVYFPSRHDILTVLIEDFIAESAAAQRVSEVDLENPAAAIATSVRGVLQLFSHKAAFITAFEQQSKYDDAVQQLWTRFWDNQVGRASRYIGRLQQADRIDSTLDATFLAESLVALALHHGLAVAGWSTRRIETLAAQLVRANHALLGLPSTDR